jgi:hypothetical protein
LYFRDEMDGQDAYHRIMAGCAVLGLGLLVAIYDQLLVIRRSLDRDAFDRKSATGFAGVTDPHGIQAKKPGGISMP